MSDASGPFAVPNFSQSVEDDEEYDGDEFDTADVDDAVDDDTVDDDDAVDVDSVDVDTADVDSVDVDRVVASNEADDSTEPINDVSAASIDGGVAQSVLEHIARSIVDDPDAVVVDVSSQRGGVRLDLHVASSDMGRIIGRRGRVAQALRSVVRAAAAADGTDATVDIVD